MIIAPYPRNEEARLRFLRGLDLLDTPAEAALDEMTRELAVGLQVPIALVTLMDADRQWFKSRVGLDVCQTARDVSFCSYALYADAMLVVEDALRDERFRDNPLVQDAPHVRFYAGVPLRGREGWVAGTLCALDTRPRQLDPRQAQLLQDLAARVERYLFGQRQGTVAQSRGDAMRSAFQAAPFGLAAMDPERRLAAANRALCALLGQEEAVLLGSHAQALWRGDHGTPLDLAACARAGGFHAALLQRRDGGDGQVWLNAVVGDATDAPGSIVVTLVARDEGGSPWPMQEA